MSQRKKNTRRYVLRCQGVTPDGLPAKFPMKAVIFTRSNPSGSVVVLYRPGCGSQIGAFSYDALVALEATAREARQALGELIQSVPKGQVYAGYAVGMDYRQTTQLIVLPQAFRNMLPVLLTQTIILFQDTSLVYAIGAYDLLKGFEVEVCIPPEPGDWLDELLRRRQREAEGAQIP